MTCDEYTFLTAARVASQLDNGSRPFVWVYHQWEIHANVRAYHNLLSEPIYEYLERVSHRTLNGLQLGAEFIHLLHDRQSLHRRW